MKKYHNFADFKHMSYKASETSTVGTSMKTLNNLPGKTISTKAHGLNQNEEGTVKNLNQ